MANNLKIEKTKVSWQPKKIKSSSEIDLDIYEKFIPEKLNQVLNEKIKKEKNDNLSSQQKAQNLAQKIQFEL